MDRIGALKAMLALTREHARALRRGAGVQNRGDYELAAQSFENVIQRIRPTLLHTFTAVRRTSKLGQIEQAADTYERGIAVTSRTGDAHTRAELQGALRHAAYLGLRLSTLPYLLE